MHVPYRRVAAALACLAALSSCGDPASTGGKPLTPAEHIPKETPPESAWPGIFAKLAPPSQRPLNKDHRGYEPLEAATDPRFVRYPELTSMSMARAYLNSLGLATSGDVYRVLGKPDQQYRDGLAWGGYYFNVYFDVTEQRGRGVAVRDVQEKQDINPACAVTFTDGELGFQYFKTPEMVPAQRYGLSPEALKK